MGRTGIVCGAPGASVRTVSLTQGQMRRRHGGDAAAASAAWVEVTSNGGKSCQSEPGSHIESVCVNPFQRVSSEGKNKNNKRPDSIQRRRRRRSLLKHAAATQSSHSQKILSAFQASPPQVCLPTRPGGQRRCRHV